MNQASTHPPSEQSSLRPRQWRGPAIGAGLLLAAIAGFSVLGSRKNEQAADGSASGVGGLAASVAEQQAASARPQPAVAQGVGATAQQGAATNTGSLPPLPKSLAGTEVDGGLTMKNGAFYPDANALRLFEYYLSALGELDQDQLRQLIIAEIERRLPPSARQDAIAFLDRFLDYRDDAGELTGQARAPIPGALDSSIEALYALRRERFGDEVADRIFGDDEALRTVALEQRQLRLDKNLSEQERSEAIRAAEADLPPAMQEARRMAKITQRVDEIRAQGGTPEEMRARFEEAVGEEAAERLMALEKERADFQQRLDAFEKARAQLRARRKLSAAELKRAEAALLNRTFKVEDRLRAEALTQ